MKKKPIAMLLAAALAVMQAVPAFTVSAAGNPKVAIGSVTGEPGETVTVDVTLSNNPGLQSMRVEVNYDTGVLECTDIAEKNVFGTGSYLTPSDLSKNKLVLNWNTSDMMNVSTNSVLATMSFKIKDTAVNGKTELKLTTTDGNTYNYDYDTDTYTDYGIDFTNGSITVKIDESKCLHDYVNGVCSKCEKVCDHKNSDTVITKEASCTEVGSMTITCNDCGNAEEKEIPMKDHNIETLKAVDATCTETGLTAGQKCKDCGRITVEQEVIEALGHNYQKEAKVEPTCTKDGVENGERCTRCGDVKAGTVLPALGHDEVIDAAVEPTCTETGKKEGKHCSRCNGILVAQEEIPALGHTEAIDAAVEPTCTETGLTEGKHCSVCDTVIVAQQTVAAKGHTEAIDAAAAPTCTEKGKTEGKHCSVCDTVILAQKVLDETGHKFGEDGKCESCGAEAIPDCEHTGGEWKNGETAHYKICTVCGAQIETAAHEWGEYTINKEADCENSGSRTHSCTVCGREETEVIPAKGHNYANGVCTVCGAADPDYAAPAPDIPDNSNNGESMVSPSDRVNYPVVIPFGYEVKSSDRIIEVINAAADNDTVEIKIAGNTTVDKSIMESLAEKNITAVFKMSGGICWTIKSGDIEKAKKVDIGVRMNRKTVSKDKLTEIAGDNKTIQFSLRHSGDFGFSGVLTLPVNKMYNGKYANLYYVNGDRFEFIGSSLVSDAAASFVFSHASDYVIVIDDEPYGEDISSAAGVYEKNSCVSGYAYTAVIAVIMLGGFAAVNAKKRRSK